MLSLVPTRCNNLARHRTVSLWALPAAAKTEEWCYLLFQLAVKLRQEMVNEQELLNYFVPFVQSPAAASLPDDLSRG